MEVERCSGTIISVPFNRHKIDALLYHLVEDRQHLETKPVILRIHGLLGNLLDETEHKLPHILADRGYTSLTINTLLANLGLFFGFGVFDEVIPQIDRVCDYLKEAGFKKIIVAGHGLGGCMALRYGALAGNPPHDTSISGVIGIATPYSMPQTIRRRWERFGSEPSYEAIYRKAKRVFEPAPGRQPAPDESFVVKKAHGPTRLPKHSEIYTLKTWWALAGPEAEGTKTYKQVGIIKMPILLVHALNDDILEHNQAKTLGKIAIEAGNEDVTELFLEAGHDFAGRHDQLGQIIVQWLEQRF